MYSTSRPKRRSVPPASTPNRGIAHLSSLPVPLTPLLGRGEEIAGIRSLLDGDHTRLITLIGPGGIGKTRLALEVASQVQQDFAHGACFVNLESVRDPELVAATVAQTLGLREGSDHSITDLLSTALGMRHLLLVIDNMEQVADAAPWLGELLATCPRLKVLVTSRVALRVQGEQRFPVPPLSIPADIDQCSVESLSESAAVSLFVQRARAVNPAFALDEANAEAVGRICQRLDGLPLAIELAAARVNILSPASLLIRLPDRLALLRRTSTTVPTRHQTMHDAIAWSHDLLSADEQALFRRLAVFVGGFTLGAIEQVMLKEHWISCHDVASDGDQDVVAPDANLLDLVGSLVDQSLVQREDGADGEPRFRLLETIRVFGLELLDADAAAGEIRRRHAHCFLSLVEEAKVCLHGPDQVVWMHRLEAERANLRAALMWATEQGEALLGLRMASSLWWFWWVRGEYSEGLATLDALLSLPAAAARTSERGRALTAAGSLAMMQSPARDIGAMHREALSITRDVGDQHGVAMTLLGFGYLAFFHHGDPELASARLTESLKVFQTLGDRWGCAAAHYALGRVQIIRGDLKMAEAHLDQALALGREDGDKQGIAASLNCLGMVARATGDIERTVSLHREALVFYRAVNDRGNIAPCLEALAGAFGVSSRSMRGAMLLGAADALRRTIGTPVLPFEAAAHDAVLTQVRSALGEAAFASGWAHGAAMTLDEAITTAVSDEPISAQRASAPVAPPPIDAHGLSPRELEVLSFMAEGLTNQEIADALFISHRTASTHASKVLGKLGLASRTAAVAYAIRHGLA